VLLVTLPWDSAQAFQQRCLAGRDEVPRIVDRFQAVGTSRPVELDADDLALALEVLDAWTRAEQPPPGIPELRDALREEQASFPHGRREEAGP
jgi:hypothetical protein